MMKKAFFVLFVGGAGQHAIGEAVEETETGGQRLQEQPDGHLVQVGCSSAE